MPQAANENWASPIYDHRGAPMQQAPSPQPPSNLGGAGPPPPGSDAMIDIAGLKKNVGFLNWAAGIIFLSGLAAIVASYLMIAGKIEDRYDRIGDKIENVSSQITDLRVQMIEVKASDDAEGGPRKQ